MTATTAPAPEKASLIEDLIDIHYAPSKVFARRANAAFWGLLLVITVLCAVLYYVAMTRYQGVLDAEWAKASQQMAQNPNMTPEMMSRARGWQENFAPVVVFIILTIAMLVSGLFTWLVAKFVDATMSIKAGITIATLSSVPAILMSLATTLQGFIMDTSAMTGRHQMMFGPARFLAADASPVMVAVLMRFDLFTIWGLILTGIGISVIGKVSTAKGMTAAIVLWVLGLVPQLAGAFMQAKAASN